MTEYKTIYTSRRFVDEILNDVAVLGLKLKSKQNAKREDGIKTLGPYYDSDNDKPLVELVLEFNDESDNAYELSKMFDEYYVAKDKQLRYQQSSISKFVTGIVFGSLLTIIGLCILIPLLRVNTLGAVLGSMFFFIVGTPAIPLCIWGIVRRRGSVAKEGAENAAEEIDTILQKARDIKNNQA